MKTDKIIKKHNINSKGSSLTPLSRLVRPIVKQLLPMRSVYFQQLFEAWPDLVKSTEAEGSIPEKLIFPKGKQSDGLLALWTLTGAQAMEISFSQKTLIHRINAFFGASIIGEIKVTAYPTSLVRSKESATPAAKSQSKNPSQSLDKLDVQISNPILEDTLRGLYQVIDSRDVEIISSSHHSGGNSHA